MTHNTKDYKFIVSSRKMDKNKLIHSVELWDEFIVSYFREGRVNEVFGSTPEPCTLNGGRPFQPKKVFTYDNIAQLNSFGIGFMLTLTNHHYSAEAYRILVPILERLENGLNSAVITNDKLAKRIKEDFPGISIKASVIKQLATHDEIYNALELYDYVCLVPWLNDDEKFLTELREKERIVLFANSNCLYRCRRPICYKQISDYNFYQLGDAKPVCNLKLNEKNSGNIKTYTFDLSKPKYKGFINFKLVPVDFARMLSSQYITCNYSQRTS